MLPPKQIEQFSNNPPATPRAGKLWKSILSLGDVFAQSLGSKDFKQTEPVDEHGDKPLNPFWKLTAGPEWPKKFLPIRAFRTPSPIFPSGENTELLFLSSGTASGPDGRSKSGFSSDGEKLYRLASLKTFAHVTKLVSGLGVTDVKGVSLVPPVAEWSDSSLARMIHWIADLTEVSYANYLSATDVQNAVDQGLGKPVFVFGTAFHLIDLLDSGAKIKLPKNSFVVETGGTKGKTRSVTRPELYELIAEGFGIEESRIVSEYGMCELASQAYDFVEFGRTSKLSDRRFRFPAWSPVKVMPTEDAANSEGIGVLVIWDQARIDVGTPIQTEDMGRVYPDGSFELLGRIPTAPLKGCSLKVDDLRSASNSVTLTASTVTPSGCEGPLTASRNELLSNINARAMLARQWLKGVAADQTFLKRLSSELGSLRLAQNAVSDLSVGSSGEAGDFATAAKVALGETNTLPLEWIVIPASTHSLACLQTLSLMFTLGLRTTIRLSPIMGESPEGSALQRAAALAQDLALLSGTLPSTWKISAQDALQKSIVAFGDDTTIDFLRGHTSGLVCGFGNLLSGTWTDTSEWTRGVIEQIARDNVALAQRGCMSARINIVKGQIPNALRTQLRDTFASMLGERLTTSVFEQTARGLEIVRLKQLGCDVVGDATSPFTVAFLKDPSDPAKLLSRLDFVFVFIEDAQNKTQSSDISQVIPGLKRLAVSEKLFSSLGERARTSKNSQFLEYVRVGTLNAPMLSGLHEGRAIFAERVGTKVK